MPLNMERVVQADNTIHLSLFIQDQKGSVRAMRCVPKQ